MKKLNKMLIYAVVAILVVLAIVVVISSITAKQPTKAIDNFTNALVKGDFAKAKEYTADQTFDIFGIDQTAEDIDMIKLYYKNIDVKVNKVTKSKDSAVVNIEVSNKDLGKVLSMYMVRAQELALQRVTNSSVTEKMEKELEEYFKSLFEGDTVQTTTNSVDVVLVKQDGKWKIVVDNNLRDVLLPGLYSIANLFTA